ncbi:NADP-dependent oxidoreductase [Citricoccus sp. GCM10030269]|uniref:NADP-dependent oxidoreductase n=1 Tax=Citricoccus sp. GCM10030269 TaxID=3273388 RepID=UPI0036179603
MRAIGFREPGEPDVLEVVELPDPTPGDGEVVIRVHAAAVNPTDTARRSGFAGPSKQPPPYVPGMDAAGILEEIGPGVQTDLSVGDRVMAIVLPRGSHGAYAEKVAVPADSVVAAPRDTSHAEASTLPMNGLTARRSLDMLGLEPGSTLVVTGAAGAMGGYAVQLAKADGLFVIADAAEKDETLVSDLGADVVLRRGEGFAERVRERYPDGADAAIDAALLLDAVAPAVKDGGTIITLRGQEGTPERDVVFRPVFVAEYATEHEKLDTLRRQAEDGTVTLRVAEVLPKEQAPEAHRRLDAGGVRGRLVLEF